MTHFTSLNHLKYRASGKRASPVGGYKGTQSPLDKPFQNKLKK